MSRRFISDAAAAHAVLDGAAEGILIAELESRRFRYANSSVCAMFGYALEDMLGLCVADIHPPEHLQEVIETFEKQARGEITVARDMPCLRKSGAVFYADISTSKVVINGLDCNVGFFTDVTGRVMAERELSDSAARYRDLSMTLETIFDSIPDILGVQDLEHGILRYNRAGYDYLGTTPEKVAGKKCYQLIGRDHPCETCATSEVYRTRRPARIERHIDEIDRWLEIRAYPVLDGDGNLVRIIEHLRDITDTKKAEADRIAYEQQLQQTQRLESLGILAGGIAHDFNNLLGGIYGFVDIARSRTADDTIRGLLESTVSTMNRARNLTQQLLTFAKGGAPQRRTASLGKFIRETTEFALSGSSVSANFLLPPDLWLCDYDANQMGQVLDNLVINALQAMPAGGEIRVSAENVTLGASEHNTLPSGRYVRVSVADTGIGIPHDIQARLFDPFFTTKQTGSGLGLATSYSIVKKHDGHIDVESTPGEGSVFHVLLPASHAAAAEASQPPPQAGQTSGLVIVMDDEEVLRTSISQALRMVGYTVELAPDGRRAVTLFDECVERGEPVGAVLLDLTVAGGMGGRQAAELIRQRDRQVPLIVTSGYSEDPILQNPQDYGFTDSIAKPFLNDELYALLKKHIQ